MTRPAPSLQSIIELSRLSALSRRGFLGGAAALGRGGAGRVDHARQGLHHHELDGLAGL